MYTSENCKFGVRGTFHPVGEPTNALRHVAEECADFAGGGAVVVAPPAVFAGVVAADVTALADAGKVTLVWPAGPMLGWRSQPTLLGWLLLMRLLWPMPGWSP